MFLRPLCFADASVQRVNTLMRPFTAFEFIIIARVINVDANVGRNYESWRFCWIGLCLKVMR